ncbi:hypothetical protein Nepgr_002650 [Nepenthes gracilis]|uniref:Uncharacterized protein n=1 Tax=Nepenthes gracilis TaxID=150966 RepID=A0AAD3P785_NEPGR|nr:hypothetical protein Nepgr_002650 [Nepenthes gracilis]
MSTAEKGLENQWGVRPIGEHNPHEGHMWRDGTESGIKALGEHALRSRGGSESSEVFVNGPLEASLRPRPRQPQFGNYSQPREMGTQPSTRTCEGKGVDLPKPPPGGPPIPVEVPQFDECPLKSPGFLQNSNFDHSLTVASVATHWGEIALPSGALTSPCNEPLIDHGPAAAEPGSHGLSCAEQVEFLSPDSAGPGMVSHVPLPVDEFDPIPGPLWSALSFNGGAADSQFFCSSELMLELAVLFYCGDFVCCWNILLGSFPLLNGCWANLVHRLIAGFLVLKERGAALLMYW